MKEDIATLVTVVGMTQLNTLGTEKHLEEFSIIVKNQKKEKMKGRKSS